MKFGLGFDNLALDFKNAIMKKILFILPIFLFALTAMAQELPVIEVEGKSEISVMPDEVQINVSLIEKSMNVKDVTNALNKKTKSIKEALEKTGIKEYEFTIDNYYVNVNRIYTKGTSRDSGYVATQNVKILVKNIDADMVKMVETLHQTANMGFNLSFNISEEQKKAHDKQLLELAIADAKSKAETIAGALGIDKINVHKVNYTSGQNNFQPIMMRSESMMMKSADAYQAPIFSPEAQKLTDRILVSFSFAAKP